MIEILAGDCRETLKTLADQSINTCITSPPYWGLRDYGTTEWEGGDPNCDHVEPSPSIKFQGRDDQAHTKKQYKKQCPKCGAIRKDKQLGMEETPEEFVENLVQVFREVKRVLRDDGTVWLNLGDSYISGKSRYSTKEQTLSGGGENQKKYGSLHKGGKKDMYGHPFYKDKDLAGIPWRVAFALQADGWYLRQDIIWHKPNPMPESVKDRCTKAHEYIFLLSKSPKYYFDNEAIKEDSVTSAEQQIKKRNKSYRKNAEGNEEKYLKQNFANDKYSNEVFKKRNKRSVWTVNTKAFKGAHFATFPMDLIEPCVLAGCLEGGTVLDPFGGSGTTGQIADGHNRNAILCELNPEYIEISKKRLGVGTDLFSEVEVKND